MNYKIRARLISLIICISFILVSFFSMFFIASHTCHDCVGRHCTVCMKLENAHKALKQLGTGATGAIFISIALGCFVLLAACAVIQTTAFTPVDLKIRLNY